jgi:hypothetical protein
MNWSFPPVAPETVHIYTVKGGAESGELDLKTHIAKDLRDCGGGYAFDYKNTSGSDVREIVFCVYLSEHNDNSPDIRALRKLGGCFVRVVFGRANISYEIKTKACDGRLEAAFIRLQSSAEIAAGILGYSYDFFGKEISVAFPGKISAGISEYPMILLAENSKPIVKIVSGSNSDVSLVQRKIPFWQLFLSRIFKKRQG